MYELLKENIIKNSRSSPEIEKDLEEFCQLFERKKLNKKEFLLEKGQICRFEAFVTKGLFKIYHIDIKGNEQILQFAIEDWWLTDFHSFNNQEPSRLYIQALKKSEVLVITKEKKELAYHKWPFTERLFRIMTQNKHIALQCRMIDNLSKTADQRYIDFFENYPKIAKQLSNIQIAAYIGVSSEFISKIRKKIFRKAK